MEDLWDTVPQIGNARQNLCIKVYVRQKDELLAKEEDMDTYIRNHENDFIGQAEESVPIKSCQRLFELFDIDTDWLEL